MLKLKEVNTYYGPSHVLQDVSLEVKPGEIVCLLGANAAGKTTTMKTIFGLVHPRSGSVLFDEQPIEQKLTGEIVASGLALVPEARRIFSRMSVLENLEMGAYSRKSRSEVKEDIDRVCEIFPRVKRTFLSEFVLDCGLPLWRYEKDGVVVEKRVIVPHQQNTSYVFYEVVSAPGEELVWTHVDPDEQVPVCTAPNSGLAGPAHPQRRSVVHACGEMSDQMYAGGVGLKFEQTLEVTRGGV